MEIITDIAQMQQLCLTSRQQGLRIAFVPTMGYLHEGHLSLLRAARATGDILVLSIFVNPAQFGAGEDFDSYPRDLSRDAELARASGTNWLFAPPVGAMYPQGYGTWVNVEGITSTLCGASRPGHFQGVTTVVCKLINIVQPHVAFFGRKDFQQLAVIRRMSTDLNLPVEVRGLPIVREADGLAMSSRNVNLSPAQRQQALALYAAIRAASSMVRGGERDSLRVIQAVRKRIEQEPEAAIDYVQICHEQTLADCDVVHRHAVLLLAVRIGATRLIDNHHLGEEIPES
ncbi:pantothenate synthetase [Geoalkalibacter ferrihydriticus]|uniref:Pantothenate synthetase n=2 Tax=Geoalkalibacter ferrihydriticus TaxID=392333 RepID=A0A0C2EB58_9BACT|nr:pantoate--beta-alanine ligase [Geoalkalibacter ferrihydriticus]KIH75823.1 pantoate--beta-alanine ligase [Geoalkalibacter ferrihydriticus DSM 17813]SDM66622.1 pantothenate synthetase [Geoalkalibacter ferrihydriticus]